MLPMLLPVLPLLLLLPMLPVLPVLLVLNNAALPTTSATQPIIIFASPTPTTPPSALLVLISAVKEYYEHSQHAQTHTNTYIRKLTHTHKYSLLFVNVCRAGLALTLVVDV